MTTQIFKEFIQFAYFELQTPGWKERMDFLCRENVRLLCCDGRKSFNTIHEVDEEEEVVISIIFKDTALDDFWFKSWFVLNYPEQEWTWDLRDKFSWFMFALTYEELMEIIGLDFCLK
jgi:hypothetical protein